MSRATLLRGKGNRTRCAIALRPACLRTGMTFEPQELLGHRDVKTTMIYYAQPVIM